MAKAKKPRNLNFLPKKTPAFIDNVIKGKSYTPVLILLLVVAAFLIGMLVTKIQYLEKSAQNQAPAVAQQQQQGQQPPTIAPGQRVNVDAGNLPVMGDKNAKVTVVEFADYQCPYCEKWFTDSEQNLINDYVKTGKVKFAFRDYAFLGQESNWAAEAARCANDQGKFWDYHDYLYKHQGSENSGTFTKDNLKKFAADLGLDTTQFNACLDADKYAKAAADDLAAGQKAGVSGTPTIYVNGLQLVGAQPYDTLKQTIDQELSK